MVDAASDAMDLEAAEKLLAIEVERMSKLTGLEMRAAKRRDGNPGIALVILGETRTAIETTGATALEAVTSATTFLGTVADAVTRRRLRMAAPAPGPPRELPKQPTRTAGSVRRLGT